jgi:hypothetical protein
MGLKNAPTLSYWRNYNMNNVIAGINIVLFLAAPPLFLNATAGLSKLFFAITFFIAFANLYLCYKDMKKRVAFVVHEDSRREEDEK